MMGVAGSDNMKEGRFRQYDGGGRFRQYDGGGSMIGMEGALT